MLLKHAFRSLAQLHRRREGSLVQILGIDPGLTRTGYGVVTQAGHQMVLVEAGVIRPGKPEIPLETRLAALYDGLEDVLAHFRPHVLALEDVFSHRKFPASALWLSHARGVVCLAAAKAGVRVHSYTPASVKLALVGQGRASKEQVQHMVGRRLGLAQPPAPPDLADALALAITHLDAAGGAAMAAGRQQFA